MKKKIIAVALIFAIIILSCTGCFSLRALFSYDPTELVLGALDMYFKGECTEEFLKTSGKTEDECDALYEEKIQYEAESFMYYFDIDKELISQETQSEIVRLCSEIYSAADYSVDSYSFSNDAYVVSITINPVDIIQNLLDDCNEYSVKWDNRFSKGEFDGLSKKDIEEDWASGIIELTKNEISKISYSEPVKASLEVTKEKIDGKTYYNVSDDDINAIGDLIVSY